MPADLKPLEICFQFQRIRETDGPYGHPLEGERYRRMREGQHITPAFDVDHVGLRDHWDSFLAAELDDDRLLEFGRSLRRDLEPADLSRDEQDIKQALEAGIPVYLTMQSYAEELYDVPWEALVWRGEPAPLAALPCLLRYQRPGTSTSCLTEGSPEDGGRILFAWAEGEKKVPHDAHLEALREACASGGLPFASRVEELAFASLPELDARLQAARRGSPISVLHILCHGGPIRAEGRDIGYGLVWNTGGSETGVISALDLYGTLRPFAGMVRLVVLSACYSGGRPAPGSHLCSVAQGVHAAGVQTVVASRIPLTVLGSVLFAKKFYSKLLSERCSVEVSFQEAKQWLFLHRHKREARLTELPGLDYAALQLHGRREDGWDTHPLKLPFGPWLLEPGAKTHPPSLTPPRSRTDPGPLASEPGHSQHDFAAEAHPPEAPGSPASPPELAVIDILLKPPPAQMDTDQPTVAIGNLDNRVISSHSEPQKASRGMQLPQANPVSLTQRTVAPELPIEYPDAESSDSANTSQTPHSKTSAQASVRAPLVPNSLSPPKVPENPPISTTQVGSLEVADFRWPQIRLFIVQALVTGALLGRTCSVDGDDPDAVSTSSTPTRQLPQSFTKSAPSLPADVKPGPNVLDERTAETQLSNSDRVIRKSPGVTTELYILSTHSEDDESYIIDIRILNPRQAILLINSLDLEVLDVQDLQRKATRSYLEASRNYDVDISKLSERGQKITAIVAQKADSNNADRFTITLAAPELTLRLEQSNMSRVWRLRPTVFTTDGAYIGRDIMVTLP